MLQPATDHDNPSGKLRTYPVRSDNVSAVYVTPDGRVFVQTRLPAAVHEADAPGVEALVKKFHLPLTDPQ